MDAREKYEALKEAHDATALRNRKKEMELLRQAYDELAVEVEGVVTPYLDKNGHEVLDPTPLSPPVGYVPQPSITERLRELIAGERMRRTAELREMDTFEEADDFDVDDDVAPMRDSPWENEFDPPVRDLVRDGQRSLSEKERLAAEAAAAEAARRPAAPNDPPAD